jgi:hypothetical protein
MFLFFVPYFPLSHFPSNVVSIVWSRCINLDNFTSSATREPRALSLHAGVGGSAAWEWARAGMEGSLERCRRAEVECFSGVCLARCMGARVTSRKSLPPPLAWSSVLTQPPPPSLHRSRETFPPFRRAPPPRTRRRDTDTSRVPSTRAEPHRSKQAASTPSAATEPHAHAATDEDAAEALRGEVVGAGDSVDADAPVERALVDGRLDAIETH